MGKSVIVYVDGFNLYNGVHDAFGHKYLWLDLVKLVQDFRPKHVVVRIKYFTAQLLDEPDAQSRQMSYWKALQDRYGDQIEIIEGKYKRSPRTCKKCGHTWDGYEEKETDVRLALEIARDALEQEATDYYLISGDSDAAPAIREAQRINPSGFYLALFPPKRHSDDLQSLMPNSIVIGESRLRQAQLPEEFSCKSGSRYERPLKWKPSRFLDPESYPTEPHQEKAKVTATPGSIARHVAPRDCVPDSPR